jgi:hypothetical protein
MRKIIVFLICCFSFSAYAGADSASNGYVRYSYDAALKQIDIYAENSEFPVTAPHETTADMDKKGVVLFNGKEKRVVTYNQKIGKSAIKTVITISPPGNKAAYLPEVTVYVDGVKRIYAPIGIDNTPYQIFLDRVSISADRIKVWAYSIYPKQLLDIVPLSLENTDAPLLDNNFFSNAAAHIAPPPTLPQGY